MSLARSLNPIPNAEQRRIAAEQHQRANQWLVAKRPELAVPLLLHCCVLDPGNLIYRQTLRTAERRMRPARGVMGRLKRWHAARRLRSAKTATDWRLVLQIAEEILVLDPDHVGAHLALATAFEAAGLVDHAVWCLEQAQRTNQDSEIIAELARLYERTGKLGQARELKEPPKTVNSESEEFVESLSKRLEEVPGDTGLYLQMVRQHRAAGDLDAAQDWLSRGLLATANDFSLALEQAQIELDRLRQDLALAEQNRSRGPLDQDMSKVLSQLRHEIQAREIEICRQRADHYVSTKQWRLDLGILLLKASRFDAALEEFEKVRDDDRLAWRAILYAGYCHLNNRQWRKAKPLFEKALQLIPPAEEITRKEVLFLLAQHAADVPTKQNHE